MEWSNERALDRLKKFGFPRQPGTDSLIQARDIIYEELKKEVDNAKIEEFKYSDVMKPVLMAIGIAFLILIFLKAFFWLFLFWLSMIISILSLVLFILIYTRYAPRMIFSRFKNEGPFQGYNIVGKIPATEEEKRVLIIGAHYDTKSNPKIKRKIYSLLFLSPLIANLVIIVFGIILFFIKFNLIWWSSITIWLVSGIEFCTIGIFTMYNKISNNSPGINDNGSGVAIVLELASIFSKQSLKHITMICVLFDAEEIGIQGSAAYVKLNIGQLTNNAWMVNFDELGGKLPIKVATKAGVIPEDHRSELIPHFDKAVKNNLELLKLLDKGKIKINVNSIVAQSDHAPFFVSKIPSVYLETSNKMRHSENDNWENFNPESFEVSGLLLEAFIKELEKDLER
jgi:hypothetical protein